MSNYIKYLNEKPAFDNLIKLDKDFAGVTLSTNTIPKEKPFFITVPITPEQGLVAIGMALHELGI